MTGVAFGLLPAWQASKPDLLPALKNEGAMRADGRGFTWSWRVLMIGQVALSLIVLVSAGLFGVIAYAVHQRTREIGIRMALGAQSSDVLQLILREGVLLVSVGLVLGVAGAFAATQFIVAFLSGVEPNDPATFLIASGVLMMVALLACWIPARRATRVDPMVALRTE